MLYQGQTISVSLADDGIAQMCFDMPNESVNKLNQATVAELGEAATLLAASDQVKGLIISSAKPTFIVGADITEFGKLFVGPEEMLMEKLAQGWEVFNAIEDLPFPTVTAINGYALGGGYELALATDYRVMSADAKVGLPETKLGIYPGFGGTVRLPRLIGVDNAVEWIAAAKEYKPEQALQHGAVDAVVATEQLLPAARDLLQQCLDGKFDHIQRRAEKLQPLKLSDIEAIMAFTTCKALVAQQAGKNFPAPIGSVKSMEKAAKMGRDEALKVEAEGFIKLAKTSVSQALIGLFLNDQELSKLAGDWSAKADKVKQAAVLGAGIMGGGIAYQSAYKGTPILMKDIDPKGLELGLAEANKLLAKRVARGRMQPGKMGEVLNRIVPTLNYGDFGDVDMVVEAVVENPKVKTAVLQDVEKQLADNAIIASNTSTISITQLASGLQRPQNFCGMHFFNPVHAMPLVEVIRGEQTSDEAIAKTVAFATSMGKKVVVVNDCAGFLVNRVLFPYFGGFVKLVKEGVDFKTIDRVMEKWGWPMGPAYLADVVGIDTCVHGGEVMAEAYPSRMAYEFKTALDVMVDAGRLGQKNNLGFYDYQTDKKGKPKKIPSEQVADLLQPHIDGAKEVSDEEIIDRLILPMAIEMARCLEECVVATAAEADMSLIFGIGFPLFRGGILRYMDSVGLDDICQRADRHRDLGGLYEVTDGMREMAANQQTYFA